MESNSGTNLVQPASVLDEKLNRMMDWLLGDNPPHLAECGLWVSPDKLYGTMDVDGHQIILDLPWLAWAHQLQWSKAVVRDHVYATTSHRGKNLYLHRIIAKAPKGAVVDHIDGCTLNCRESNLRITDHKGNAQNRAPNKGRRFKGVKQCAAGWRASIKGVSLGTFPTEELAAAAYAAAKLHFKEFARLNLPGEAA